MGKYSLQESHHIGRIILHPKNPDILWVASLGHLYSPSTERGIYKSTDGGKSWENKLFINQFTGAIDLVIDNTDPDILYCSMWEKDRKAWNFDGSGIGSGIFKSEDGGESWIEISGGDSGFPDTDGTGRIGLDISLSNPNILYAILDNQDRRQDNNNVNNNDLSKDKLRSISTTDFLKFQMRFSKSF